MAYFNTDTYLKTAKIVIPSSQVLTMGTSPVTLLPAPQVGYINSIYNVFAKMDFNSTAYATANTIAVTQSGTLPTYTGGNSFLIQLFLQNTSSSERAGTGNSILISSTNSFVARTTQSGASTNPTNGDSDITIYVVYSETPL